MLVVAQSVPDTSTNYPSGTLLSSAIATLLAAFKAFRFKPRLLAHRKNYGREDFVNDLAAGVTVAMVALPLTDLSAATVMVPMPEADVVTGGIS